MFYKISLALLGVSMLALGIIMLSARGLLINYLAYFTGAILLIHGVRNLFHFITRGGRLGGEHGKAKLITAAVNIAGGAAMAAVPELTFLMMIYVLCAYFMFNGASKLFDFIVAKAEHERGHYIDLAAFAFYFVFAALMIGNRRRDDVFFVLAGIYSLLLGTEMVSDLISLVIPQRVKNDLKRHIRISPPVFVTTFLPLGTLRRINEYLSADDAPVQLPQGADEQSPPDIEIMVHVSEDGAGRIGHLDLYFGGEVISYGNHDNASHRLFGVLGDGVLFTADREIYLDFSVEHDRQVIFSYGLRLTPEQKEAVRSEIELMKADSYPWEPPIQQAVERYGDDKVDPSGFKDYCSELWYGTHAKFRKFSRGKFRTYSILSTNCVLLTDTILGKAGTDIVCISGVSSPGIYYDYLERLYLARQTMVISKTIYNKASIRSLKKKG
ncbi:MAG: DUF308 domain-containing protein [Ruminiclostridium sp.]|nr:DUF308 domain-containing protein [Ruminiclostridium sp.]